MIEFGDSTIPPAIPFQYAALYAADADYPCPPGEDQRWNTDHKRWITFHGDTNSSTIDFEPGTAAYSDPQIVHNWLWNRKRSGKTRHAWVYSDLSNAEYVARACTDITFYWWVATLDGAMRSTNELQNLLIHWGVPSYQVVGRVEAQQYGQGENEHGKFDKSICFSGWV